MVHQEYGVHYWQDYTSFETYQIIEPSNIVIRPTDLQNDWNSLRFGLSYNAGIITSAYICFRTKDLITPEYGHLLLHTYDLKKIFYGLGSGLRQNLDWRDFKYLPCLVPTLSEQADIVCFLDHYDRKIRRFIYAKQKLIKLLEEQKQAIIKQAVTRGVDPNVRLKHSGVEWLGDVPVHWEVKRLKWVTRLQRGYDLPQDRRISGLFPVVSSGGIIDNHCEAKSKGPGVVMGRCGSTNAVFYIERDFWPHNTSLFVTKFQGNYPRWCYYLLRTISKADHAGKSAVPAIDRKDLFDIYVPAPPPNEQISIVEKIDSELKIFDFFITNENRQIDLIREYRTRLIADVVTGKLDVRNVPIEEPEEIEELLELEDLDEESLMSEEVGELEDDDN